MWPFNKTLSKRYSKLVKLIKSIDSHFQLTEDNEDSLRLHLPNYKGNQPMDFHIYLMEPFLFISFKTELEGEKISCLNNFQQDTDQQEMFNTAMANNLNKVHQVLNKKNTVEENVKENGGNNSKDLVNCQYEDNIESPRNNSPIFEGLSTIQRYTLYFFVNRFGGGLYEKEFKNDKTKEESMQILHDYQEDLGLIESEVQYITSKDFMPQYTELYTNLRTIKDNYTFDDFLITSAFLVDLNWSESSEKDFFTITREYGLSDEETKERLKRLVFSNYKLFFDKEREINTKPAKCGVVNDAHSLENKNELTDEQREKNAKKALAEYEATSQETAYSNQDQKDEITEALSTEASDDDIADVWTDKFGVKYSPDKKRLIHAPEELQDYTILEGTEIICDDAFSNSENLVSVTIPGSVREIGQKAFASCNNLISINLSGNVKLIKEAAFENCKSLSSFIIRAQNDTNKRVQISRNAFAGCESIEYLEWPEADEITLYTYLSDSVNIKKVVGKNGDIDAEIVLREDEIKLKAMSLLYNSIGMNVTKIRGNCKDNKSFKNIDKDWPHSIEEFYDSSQSKSFILSENWYRNSGIGAVLGWNKYRAIDVDHIGYYYKGDIDSVIVDFLSHMGIPEDYPWVVKSGSGSGFHIIFKSEMLKDELSSKAYTPNFQYACYGSDLEYFDRLELRWKDHLVLPPSIHFSGKRYEFWRGIPDSEPTSIQIYNIDNLVFHYCGRININKYNLNGKTVYLVETCKYYTSYDDYGCFAHGKVSDTLEWQKKSNTPEANNSIGIRYVLGNDVNVNKEKALHYFLLSDSDVSNYNIASLIACGYFEGSQNDVEDYLSRIKDDHTFSLVNYDTYDESITAKLYQQVRQNYADLPNEEDLSTEVTEEDLANAWTDEFGVKYSPDKKRLIHAPGEIQDYIILDGTEIICDDAFFNIEFEDFDYYEITEKGLTPYDFVKSLGKLTSVCIPSSVIAIGERAFQGCSLKKICIPIGEKEKFEKLLPDYKYILLEASNYDNHIVSSTNNIPTNVWTDEFGVQYDREQRILLRAPKGLLKYTVLKGTKVIGHAAFSNCEQLKSVVLPDSVTEIGHYAFAGCKSIFSFAISNHVRILGTGAFMNCSELWMIRIPEDIIIENDAFEGCNNLYIVYVPTGEKYKYDAFFSGYNVSINEYNQQNQNQVEILDMILHGTLDEDGVLYDVNGYVLLSKIKKISEYEIKPGTYSIASEAFMPRLWKDDNDTLKKLYLPDSVKKIGYAAFAHNEGLEYINIPKKASFDCYYNPFAGCTNLHTIKWETELFVKEGTLVYNREHTILLSCLCWQYIDGIKNCWPLVEFAKLYGPKMNVGETVDRNTGETIYYLSFHDGKGGERTLASFNEKLGCLTPNEIVAQKNELIIVQLLSGRYMMCKEGITKIYPDEIVELPEGLETIAADAFYGNEILEEITLPNSIIEIGENAFGGCTSLRAIYVPNGQKGKFMDLLPEWKNIICEKGEDDLPF